MAKIIVIGGPTSSGKTNLAIQIANDFNGELINADSRQIYKYLDIGTNKGNVDGIHLVNIINPDERFSVYDYKILAEKTIWDVLKKGKLPILVGGTGLYIDAIIKDYDLETIEASEELRAELDNKSLSELQLILGTEKVNSLNASDRNNPRRLIRLIEKSKYPEQTENHSNAKKYSYLFLYPVYDWTELKAKIENRVEEMFQQGIVEETKKVLELGFPKTSVALQGIGYKQVLNYIDGIIDLKTCIELVKTAHKQYARRQRTWFEGEARNYNLNRVTSISDKKLISNFLAD